MAKPKNTFNAGDDILAEEINENFEEVWQGVGIYGESSEGSDDYAIDADVNEYYEGMVVSFKADVSNSGDCTLNVNGLGAKKITIKTLEKGFYGYDLHHLAPYDIQAGQIVSLVYDGTDFQYLNFKKTTYKTGNTTRDASITGTQNIEHGLGFTPKKLKITAILSGGEYHTCIGSVYQANETTSMGVPQILYLNRNAVIGAGINVGGSVCVFLGDGGNTVTATATMNETNIILTWAKTGTPTGSIGILWEIEA